MPITMTTFAGSTVTPRDDAMIYDAALGMNGILNGCAVRLSGNVVTVESGYAVVCGRHLNITEESLAVELAGSSTLKGRVYIHMDLQSGSDPSTVAELRVERAETLSILRQDAGINFNNGIYEYELATFDVTQSALTNLVYTAKTVSSLRELIGDPNDLSGYSSIASAIKTLGQNTGNQISFTDAYSDPSAGNAASRTAASGKAVYDLYSALSRSISNGLAPIALDSSAVIDFNEAPYTQTGIWGFNQNNQLVNGPFSYETANVLDNGGWIFTIATDSERCKQFVFRLSTNNNTSVQIWHRTMRSGRGVTAWQRFVNYSDYANFDGDITFAKSETSPALYYYSDGTNKTTLIGDNGSNIWIGANKTNDGNHHIGGLYISSGYNASSKKGNSTIFISVPDKANLEAKNYGVWHEGNAKCVTALKEVILRNIGKSKDQYRIFARDGIFGDKNLIELNTGDNTHGIFARGHSFKVQNTDHSAYAEAWAKKWNTDSSKLVKENIEDITDEEALKLLQLRPVSFNYKKEFTDHPEENNFGLIAEEVLEVIPETVTVPEGYDEAKFDVSKGLDNDILSIDYSKFVPHLIKMVQIQQAQIDYLMNRLEAMDGNV